MRLLPVAVALAALTGLSGCDVVLFPIKAVGAVGGAVVDISDAAVEAVVPG